MSKQDKITSPEGLKFRKSKPFVIRVEADEYDFDPDWNLTDELISIGGFSIDDPYVGHDHDPLLYHPSLSASMIGEETLYLVNFGIKMTTKQVLDELEKRGFIPANYGHLLIFGIQHRRVCREYIVALGTLIGWGSSQLRGSYYPYLCTKGDRRVCGKGHFATQYNVIVGPMASDHLESHQNILWPADTCFLVLQAEEDIFLEES